jgi:hypothetical protein
MGRSASRAFAKSVENRLTVILSGAKNLSLVVFRTPEMLGWAQHDMTRDFAKSPA